MGFTENRIMTTKTATHLLIAALLVGLAVAALQLTNPPLTSGLISPAPSTSDALGAGSAGLKERTGIVPITP
jgi:hypothetical protein